MEDTNQTHPNAYRAEATELRAQISAMAARANELEQQALAREREMGLVPEEPDEPAPAQPADDEPDDDTKHKRKLLGK